MPLSHKSRLFERLAGAKRRLWACSLSAVQQDVTSMSHFFAKLASSIMCTCQNRQWHTLTQTIK